MYFASSAVSKRKEYSVFQILPLVIIVAALLYPSWLPDPE